MRIKITEVHQMDAFSVNPELVGRTGEAEIMQTYTDVDTAFPELAGYSCANITLDKPLMYEDGPGDPDIFVLAIKYEVVK